MRSVSQQEDYSVRVWINEPLVGLWVRRIILTPVHDQANIVYFFCVQLNYSTENDPSVLGFQKVNRK